MVIKVGVNLKQKNDQGHQGHPKKKVKHKVNEPSFLITSRKTRVNAKEFVLDCFVQLHKAL